MGVALAGALVALVATWSVASPWDAPVWPLLAFVPVPAFVWWLTATRTPAVRFVSAVVVAVVVVGTVAVWASPVLGRLRYGDTLDRLEQAAVVVLADAPTPTEACGPPPPLDYGVLGVPDEVCVVTYTLGVVQASVGGTARSAVPMGGSAVEVAAGLNGGDDDQGDGSVTETSVRQVRFDWRSGPSGVAARNLVFEGGVAQPPAGRCVRQVDDRWWAWSLSEGTCPRGSVPSSD